jgi:hypothetical protein
MTPSAMRGVLNDAISIYFADATLASAFVARWCAPCQRSRRPGACSACAMMSRRRGSGRGCVGHREGKRDLARRNLGAEPVFLVNDSRRKP